MFEELNLPLSRNEISKAIKKLKNNKGAGLDKMISEFFNPWSEYFITIF